ncbi:zinc finger MYM-type protein 5 [Sorghum bicolor]|uniref:zinc finger MYM-type protein 5 n=1 Tax=Sorghum bicolor TaxID=4558 RepID=UPI000B424B1B|nr:zinc finger MYM-type protein 5 [Sorghum bicolor]|eukprot:XP_021304249.1 zinc finger MYM-type protein 5 [Sorghum bicolor]
MYRKYESGHEKRKKKRRLEAAAQSQKGALDRFVVKESRFSPENRTPNVDPADDRHGDDANIGLQVEAQNAEMVQGDRASIAIIADEVSGHTDVVNSSLDTSPSIEGDSIGIDNDLQADIFDPRTWDALDSKMVDMLVQKGPKRDMSIEKGPKDKFSRRFSASSYTRVLSNGEKCDREWLVYSKELDRVTEESND